MYVCICKGVSDRTIRNAVINGADFKQLRQQFGIASQCGKCSCEAKSLVKQTQSDLRSVENAGFYAL